MVSAVPPTSRPLPASTTEWWNYQRPTEYDLVGETIDVAMRDGVTIACELRRPARDGVALDGPFPGLVVEFTPYVILRDFYLGEADFFASRGYVAIVPLMRGVGRSGGEWEHGSFRQGGRDAHDLVEWLATQPYCDGRMGMVGESFGGQTAYGAAIERPEHLLAIAPMQSPGSLYHDVIHPGGIKSTERGEIDSWPDIANMTSEGAIDADAEYAANREHPSFDEFWRDRSFVDRLDTVAVPVLAMGGWNDHYFRSGSIANMEAIPERTWSIYGAWPHFFPVSLSQDDILVGNNEARAEALAATPQLPSGVLLAWFDHWLLGLPEAPIPPAPTFTSFEGPINVGHGWTELDRWDPSRGTGAVLTVLADAEPGPHGSFTFTSEPLVVDEVLIGHASLTFSAILDAPDAHFYVELLSVDAEGTETVANDGFLAASHRQSHSDPEPVPVGEAIEYRVDIRPTHFRFPAGHLVRVRLGEGPPSKLTAPPEPVTVALAPGAPVVLRLPGFSTTVS